MHKDIQKILRGPGLYVLLFVLGDIFMIPSRGPNAVSWLLILLGAAGCAAWFWRQLPRLRR